MSEELRMNCEEWLPCYDKFSYLFILAASLCRWRLKLFSTDLLKAARSSIAQDELTQEQRQAIGMGEEDQEKIRSYEEAFRRIKEATGVSDTQVCLCICFIFGFIEERFMHLFFFWFYRGEGFQLLFE